MGKIVLALDLGGTNARFAAVREDGQVLARANGKTPRFGTSGPVLQMISGGFAEVAEMVGSETFVGVAAAVPFGSGQGVLTDLPNLPALEGVDLGDEIRRGIGLPVEIVNDATAATIGEHWLGASHGFENVIGVTLGTGVGGGLIIGGKPYFGASGSAGEVGHICVEPDGHRCGCGSFGCVEQYASGTAIVRMANEAGLSVETSFDLFGMAKAGDVQAAAVFHKMGTYLGIAFAGLVNLLNPDLIVVGGGVSAGWELFIEDVRNEVSKRAFRDPAERVKIVRASLGDDAGVLGAARIAFERMD